MAFHLFSSELHSNSGKFGDPEEIPDFGKRRKLLHLCDAQSQPPKNFTSDLPFVRAEEDAVAFLDFNFDCSAARSPSEKNFTMGDFHSPSHLDKCEPFCAVQLRNFS